MQYFKHSNETKVETKEDVAIIACLIERFFPQLRPLLLNSSPIFNVGY